MQNAHNMAKKNKKLGKTGTVSSGALTEWGEQPWGEGAASQAIPHSAATHAVSTKKLAHCQFLLFIQF